MRPALRFLHDAAAVGVTDAELLRRYAQAKDEAAFELLVRRHADAVWAACRRVLPADPHAAEDAFQATFLALAKKAHAIHGDCAGGWLYRVAVHAALKARRANPERQRRGPAHPAADAPGSPDPSDLSASAEAATAVHEELAQLRESYRLPVVLCDLSGLSHVEAAQQLGWPVGTVSGRLVRARDQLRRRLERRGVTLTTAGLSAVLASNSGAASSPLVRTAVIAASGSAPPAVVCLAEGVLSAMSYAKLKMAAAALCVAVGLAGTGVMVAVSQEKKAAPAEASKDQAKPEIKEPFETAFPDIKGFGVPGVDCPRFQGKVTVSAEKSDMLRRLAKARLDELVASSKLYQGLILGGQYDVNSLFNTLQIRREIPPAAGDVFGQSEELVRWYEEWVSMTKGLERIMQARYNAGNVRIQDVSQVRAERFHAEHELLKLMARVKTGQPK